MADTATHSNLTVQQWDDQFFAEYVRDNRFKRYMGTGANAVIQIKEDLTTKPGNSITFPMVTKLTNSAVTGNTRLAGNEEALGNYGHQVNVTFRRNGVLVTAEEEQKSPIGLRNAAREMLKLWAMEDTRDLVISALGAIATADGGNTAYASASESNKDSWLANNSDRVLFGAVTGNNAANDHSACLAEIDNTADKLDADIVSLAKRIAKTSSAPTITPIRTTEDEEWFVMFCNSLAFRDLKTDSTMLQANREAWTRGRDNPLFRDGDLIFDGVICREVPEISVISGVGASSIDVAPNYLCGQQAVGVAYAQRWKSSIKKEDDYGFEYGVGISSNYGCEKLHYNTKQNGVVTVYTAGVADS